MMRRVSTLKLVGVAVALAAALVAGILANITLLGHRKDPAGKLSPNAILITSRPAPTMRPTPTTRATPTPTRSPTATVQVPHIVPAATTAINEGTREPEHEGFDD
jgi:hypothetical protein